MPGGTPRSGLSAGFDLSAFSFVLLQWREVFSVNFPLQRGYRVAVEGGSLVKHAVKKREAETSLESSSRLRQSISPKLPKVAEVLFATSL